VRIIICDLNCVIVCLIVGACLLFYEMVRDCVVLNTHTHTSVHSCYQSVCHHLLNDVCNLFFIVYCLFVVYVVCLCEFHVKCGKQCNAHDPGS
jgi:hypothetical protein